MRFASTDSLLRVLTRRAVRPLGWRGLGVALLLGNAGCTSVSSVAVRTDGMPSRRHLGPVALYPLVMPARTRVIGVVTVQATSAEANVEVLMPTFIRRVADLGATGATIDEMRSRFDLRTEYRVESRPFPCGLRATCWTTQLVPYQYVVRTLEIRGRALLPVDIGDGEPAPATVPSSGNP